MRSRGIGNSGLALPGPTMIPPAPSSPAQRTNRTSKSRVYARISSAAAAMFISTFGILTATSRSRASHSWRTLPRLFHIDFRHMDGPQPQPRFAELAQAAERPCVKLGRPEMAREEHQLDPAITLVREPRHGIGGAAVENIGVGIDAEPCGCVFHACALCRSRASESACARCRPAM